MEKFFDSLINFAKIIRQKFCGGHAYDLKKTEFKFGKEGKSHRIKTYVCRYCGKVVTEKI